MRLNRTHKRPLEISRGPADRDPMFEPIWYDGVELTVTIPTKPVQEPGPQWDLAPLPPPDDRAMKWKDVIERANEVNAVLKLDRMFNSRVLVDVVCDLLDTNPSAEEIVAAYRQRMEAGRND